MWGWLKTSLELADTHCHLDFGDFDADREVVIERAREAGLVYLIVPGTDLESSRKAVGLAEAHREVFAAVGAHPHAASRTGDSELRELRKLAEHPKVVAVGEIGLDYFRNYSPREGQVRAFQSQLDMAAELVKPIIVHNRKAEGDLLAMLEGWTQTLKGTSLEGKAGVLHSFSAGLAAAAKSVSLGFYIGFTGPLTYRSGEGMRQVALSAPLERILVETDSPFLSPEGHRGKRNEPAWLRSVAAKVAEIRGLTEAEAANLTTQNARTLFGLERWA